jgi:hypothetical protein
MNMFFQKQISFDILSLFCFTESSCESDSNDEDNQNSDDNSEEDAVLSDEDSTSEESDEDVAAVIPNVALVQNTMVSKDGNEEWSKTPPNQPAHPRAHNIVRQPTGPTRMAAQTCGQSVDTSFKLFITPEIGNIIVQHTNEEGRRQLADRWIDTNVEEVYTFIGLLLLAGVYHAKNESIHELWSQEHGRPVFNRTMSRNRFCLLRRCLRFDDKATREQRRQQDKFSPLRNIMNLFSTKCRANYNPSPFITVDEQLVTFRGRCPFKMFIPSKPGKYGMKVWMLCDAESSYCINLQPYIGRTMGVRDVGQGTRVVLELTDHITGSGRHITGDNFFTNITLLRSLLGRRMTYTGTLRKNKGEVAPQFLPNARRAQHSSVFGFQNDVTMVSYVPKKSKAVLLLSTFHHDAEVAGENEKYKPKIILDYNKYKAGVDTLDQLVRSYSCRRKCRRWPFTMFCNLLDIAAYNSYILFIALHPNYANRVSHKRRIFLQELAKSLLPPTLEIHPLAPIQQLPAPGPIRPRGTTRCHVCPRNEDKKTRLVCSNCQKSVCKHHSKIVCNNC